MATTTVHIIGREDISMGERNQLSRRSSFKGMGMLGAAAFLGSHPSAAALAATEELPAKLAQRGANCVLRAPISCSGKCRVSSPRIHVLQKESRSC